jgi:uncharacterized protein YdeI (YjbR/CyaY-like superfamily)
MKAYPDVDAYLQDAERWPREIAALRPVLRGCGLAEEIKWGKPCYIHEGRNICLLQEMKGFLAVMFFKGALLDDADGVLVDQGPNSRSARRLELTSVGDVEALADTIRAFVDQAIAVEEAGLEVEAAPEPQLADELQRRIDTDPAFKAAFEALTPGRRRGYDLHIAEAKKPETRQARVDKHAPRILAGKGLHDR